MLTGILARFEAGKLIMAATDSYRLSVKETPLEGKIPDLEAIIPARALEELRRIAGGTEEVELGVQDNQVVFGVDGIWLTTRRIDGQFPNYKQLVPEQFEHEVTLPAPFAGEPLEIGFNPQFLRDGLESVEGDQVVLRLINPLRPAVIGGDGGDFVYLIMPIRLPG